ncbi:hypothetical protein XENOCAPTIV_006163, partial [Xenoophorus captivus]
YLDCLWAQIQKLKKDRWQERHILRPYIAFDSVLCEALQHNLPPFTPPGHMPDAQYPIPRVIFRILSYHQRIVDIVPPTFSALIPAEPIFSFKYGEETGCKMIAVLVDKMIRTQIVDCAAVANWLFSQDMAHEFTRLFTWEILHSTIRKMNKHVQKIQKELEESKDKLEKQQHKRVTLLLAAGFVRLSEDIVLNNRSRVPGMVRQHPRISCGVKMAQRSKCCSRF